MNSPSPGLSLSGAFDDLLVLWRREGRLLTLLALAFFALPGALLVTLAPNPKAMAQSDAAMILVLPVLMVSLIGQLAMARLALQGGISVGEAIRLGARRALPLLGALAMVLVPLLIPLFAISGRLAPGGEPPGGGLLLLFFVLLVAILAVAMRMMLAVAIAANEPGNAPQLIRRSFALAKGQGWRLAGLFLLTVTTILLLFSVIELVVGTIVLLLLGSPEPLTVAALVAGLFIQVPQALVAAAYVTMLAMVYRRLVRG